MALNVNVDLKAQRFSAVVDAQECLIDFRFPEPGVIELYHTFVPPALRRRGLAAALVQFALNYAKANNLRVIPTCPYVANYMATHS